MKIFFNALVSVGLFLLAGCASAPAPDLGGVGPQVGELTIISAVYGSGGHFADVTERVEMRLHTDNGEFFANPEWLKADPIPGWNKELVITYEYAGQRKIFNAGENSRITYRILLDYAKNRQPDRVNPPV